MKNSIYHYHNQAYLCYFTVTYQEREIIVKRKHNVTSFQGLEAYTELHTSASLRIQSSSAGRAHGVEDVMPLACGRSRLKSQL